MTASLQSSRPRLPAAPWLPGAWAVYRLLVRPALRRAFGRLLLDDRACWREGGHVLGGAAPVVCYATHTSWWDGYLAFELFRNVFPRRHFLMMEEAQLRRYGFFRWCGCFSVDRANPREAMRSVRYAARLLQSERRPLVWIFPQGAIEPADRRPLELYRGAAEIAIRAGGAWLVPVALRYEFGPEQRPDALLLCGEPHWAGADADPRALHAECGRRLSAAADELAGRWAAGDLAGFRPILRGRDSANRIFDQAMLPLRSLRRRRGR